MTGEEYLKKTRGTFSSLSILLICSISILFDVKVSTYACAHIRNAPIGHRVSFVITFPFFYCFLSFDAQYIKLQVLDKLHALASIGVTVR